MRLDELRHFKHGNAVLAKKSPQIVVTVDHATVFVCL
jgi:hypothetical protein